MLACAVSFCAYQALAANNVSGDPYSTLARNGSVVGRTIDHAPGAGRAS
jgi:hypothetical protein